MPISYREFKKMVKEAGCKIDEKGLPHLGRILKDGILVSTFSVTHSKRGKSNEVKDVYIRRFRKSIG